MTKSKQLFSTISSKGELSLSLVDVDIPRPKPHEVVVKIEAAPINPSDMWPMFGPADLRAASFSADDKTLKAPLHEGMLSRVKPRIDQLSLIHI